MDDDTFRELVTAQAKIAESLDGIKDNLKQLNDANILHAQQSVLHNHAAETNHNTAIDMLKTMTEKYWWLIIMLIAALLIVTGYTHIARLFIGGV